ncbi:MAG: DUF374 domain-containing protein [Proteobacteria bacterium]|nr:DUF374 domain-containing protein [Pseudomonadota bacterium]HQR03820.1 DUF374 domain-containing protein [Rhodocyclaceae bacterium]
MLKGLRRQLARLGPALFFLLARTWRLRVTGGLPPEPAVVAFWHGLMLPVWKHFEGRQATALVSQSRDGGLLTDLLRRWGYTVIRGSSSRGNKAAWAELVAAARCSRVLITPDGPRGPARRLKAGAVVAAHRAGVPLYLCRVRCAAAIRGTHWDRFLIPLPFAAVALDFVALPVPPTADRAAIDTLIVRAEQLLNEASTP